MDNFKTALKNRLKLLIIGILVASVAFCCSGLSGKGDELVFSGYLSGFQVGVAVITISVLGVVAYKCALALRSEEKLRKYYVTETDERELFI